ncbi:uncharacterized protein [Oscarella lobularis]|uniref:uncharacterized protein n=1 Tax=Oscarella lobularis TaxID=121494 RepID=UPI0033135E1C
MSAVALKFSLVALTLFLLLPVILPSLFVFLIYDSSAAFDWSDLGSSSCDVTISVNVSSLLAAVTLPPNISIPPRFVSYPVLRLDALTARKAISLLEAKTWPPQNLNVSAVRIFSLLELLSLPPQSNKRENHNLTCNKDLTMDEKRHCCYLSCSNWQWLTSSQESADTFLFVVNLIIGLIAFPSTSLFVLGLVRKKERTFPLVAIAWYLMLAVAFPVFAEAIGRLIGKKATVCCGKEDTFDVFLSSGCMYRLVYAFIHRFMYAAANEWLAIGFLNLWTILALLKGDSFSRNSNRIHLIQFISVWGIAFVVTLIPYTLKGPDTYTSSLLTYPLVAGDAKLDYYSFFLLIQVTHALTSVTLLHLIYTLKKRGAVRKSIAHQKSVQELEHVQRRFLVMMVFTFATALFLIINSIHRIFFVYKNNTRKVVTDYFYCIFLYPEKNCPRALPLQEFTFIRLILDRLNVLVALIGILVFFSVDKNFRSMWRKAIHRAISRRHKIVELSQVAAATEQ